MTAFALKSLGSRKLRAVLTAVAIVLGVAMISGTYILTDTIKSAFGTVFKEVYKRTDVVITARSAIEEEGENERATAPAFPESLLAQVRALKGVQEAQGAATSNAELVGRNGKILSTGGSPGLAFSVHPHGDQRFNPLTLVAGHWPEGEGEVGIDDNTAERHGYRVGQTIGVVARGAEQQMRIAGIVRIGGVASLGGTTMALFDFPVAQHLLNLEGKLTSISIAAAPGYTQAQLLREIRPLLPPNAQARSGTEQAKKATHDTSGFLNIIQNFLLAFAGIALFVGSFVIANTLSITIAQRTRELATLRTLGATRRQVLRTVLLEAFVIGLLASVAGLLLGIGLAKGLNGLFKSLGIDLPQASTVLATRTVVVSLAVGVAVTLLAALRPGSAGHPRAADRGGAGGRGAAPVPVRPPGAPGGAADRRGSARPDAGRVVRRGPQQRPAAAGDRRGGGRLLPGGGAAGEAVGAAAGGGARVALDAHRGGRRAARAGQLGAQPHPHRVHRRRADDRAGAGDVRGGPRGGPQVDLRNRGQRDLRGRLRDHRDEQLLADLDGLGSGGQHGPRGAVRVGGAHRLGPGVQQEHRRDRRGPRRSAARSGSTGRPARR